MTVCSFLVYEILPKSPCQLYPLCIHRTVATATVGWQPWRCRWGQGGFSLPSTALCALWRDLQLRLEAAYEGTPWRCAQRLALSQRKQRDFSTARNWNLRNMNHMFQATSMKLVIRNHWCHWCLENIGSSNSPSLPCLDAPCGPKMKKPPEGGSAKFQPILAPLRVLNFGTPPKWDVFSFHGKLGDLFPSNKLQ